MLHFYVQEFREEPSTFSAFTFGRILAERHGSQGVAVAAARRMLPSAAPRAIGLRVLDSRGRQVWSSLRDG